MPSFSQRSRARLITCDKRLQDLFEEVVKGFDCIILQGHRGEEEQNRYYAEGKSKLKYPQSKHNKIPSLAVDVAPYPVNWSDKERFYYFAGYVKGIAQFLGIELRWGGDWDSDTHIHDQTFFDLPHFEINE